MTHLAFREFIIEELIKLPSQEENIAHINLRNMSVVQKLDVSLVNSNVDNWKPLLLKRSDRNQNNARLMKRRMPKYLKKEYLLLI